MAGDAAAIGQLTRGQPRAVAWVRRHTFEIVLVLPLVAYITVLTIAPILDTFRLSFSAPKTGFGTLHSYQAIFKDTVFRHAVINTIIVALLSLVLEVGVGLAIALTLHVKFFGRGLPIRILHNKAFSALNTSSNRRIVDVSIFGLSATRLCAR